MLLRIACLLRVLQRDRANRMCMCSGGGGVHIYFCDKERHRERNFFYFKELANAIVRADESKVFRAGCQAGNSGRGQYYSLEFKCNQFSSVAQLCPTVCDPMDCSTPGLSVHQQPPEFTQTHVHLVGDSIQPSHPLLSPSPPACNLCQHQGLFK